MNLSKEGLGPLINLDEMASPAILPLLVLALVLLTGGAGGWLARMCHVPSITGNIITGVILGAALFRESRVSEMLQPLATFTVCLIAVTVGGHLSYRRIHNALGRIVCVAAGEVIGGAVLVYGALRLAGADPLISLMAACLSVETAPATTLAIVREGRAKGPFVKTLLGVVSLDSIACILLFEFLFIVAVDHFATGGDRLNFALGLMRSLHVFLVSAALGGTLGALATHVFRPPRFPGSSTMIVAILLAAGLSSALGVSSLLTCLALGIYLGNGTHESEKRVDALAPLEPLLYTAFFTLAGISIHLDLLAEAGVLCLVYVAARFAGKAAGAYFGARAYGASPRIARNVPLAMMPQASVAAGLLVMMKADSRVPEDFSAFIAALILSAITINEIIGPALTRLALHFVREAGLDRPKLVDFLHEEFILTDLQAADKWEALRKLTEFYGRTHNVRGKNLDKVFASIEERERQGSTALGRASALPHGRVDYGPGIQGVLAIAPKGIDFDAPDGQPVKLIVLIVTPQEHEARHLDVLASLSTMASDERIFGRLILAKDANEAWEILAGKETRSYNYFLESDDSTATA